MPPVTQHDLARIKRILPGTIVFFRWPDGVVQEAVKSQDRFDCESSSFFFLEQIPDSVALDDVPVIVVDENHKWRLAFNETPRPQSI